MDPIIGGSLVSGAFSSFGNLLGIGSNAMNNKAIARENQKNRDFSHNEAILAHQRQLEIMDKQNDWNSFSNQRKLAEDAGFNPNRIFDQGASGIATSSGASGGAQAGNPSVGFPSPLLDPSMISAIADAKLKEKQGDLIEAQTGKTNEEKIGQTIKNEFDNITKGFYQEFGRTSWVLDLQLKDRKIAESGSIAALNAINRDLGFNELTNMRPLQAMNLVSDTAVKNSQDLLNRALSAKTDTERSLAVKEYLLSVSLTGATVAKLLSEKQGQDYQNSLWRPGTGALWHQENNRKWMSLYDRNTSHFANKLYQDFMHDSWIRIKATLNDLGVAARVRSNVIKNYWYDLSSHSFHFFGLSPTPDLSGFSGFSPEGAISPIGSKITSLIGAN